MIYTTHFPEHEPAEGNADKGEKGPISDELKKKKKKAKVKGKKKPVK